MNNLKRLILNRIQCNNCKDIIISHHRHEFVTCKCNWVSCDGGLDYLKRTARTPDSYTEMSVWSNADFEIIRESLYRGGYGKDGKQPLTYVFLKDMSNNWIINCIKYNEELEIKNNYNNFYKQELEYRKENNIFIKD